MFIDIITRIRNALMMKHEYILIPHSKMVEAIILCLHNGKFIESYEIYTESKFPQIKIKLKYHGKESYIRAIKAVSKPSLRQYASLKDLKRKSYDKIYVISTSKGIMLHKEAIENNTGGEVLFYVS